MTALSDDSLTPDLTPSRLLEVAVAAARTAGTHALTNLDRRTDIAQGFAHDVKLKLDLECQTVAEQTLLSHFPSHAILGEETADDATPTRSSPYLWIIDPIDGTVNFSHGLPHWCCSVAVRHRGITMAGAVYAPALAELYTAAAGGPAECNGQRLRTSSVPRLDQALVMTGLDQKVNPRMKRFALFRAIADTVQKTRVMGAAALDICRVAKGQADGYFEAGIYTWDVAAAALILENAGGRSEILANPSPHQLLFLATNGHIHEELKSLISGHLAAE
ncbi:MAG: inositol monophosphatase family protein [bacterium]